MRTRLETIICMHNIINLLNFKPIANFMPKAAHILRNDFRVHGVKVLFVNLLFESNNVVRPTPDEEQLLPAAGDALG